MGDVNKIKVNIGGNDYVLKSTRPDTEMRQVAEYVEKKMQESGSLHRRFNKTMQATLAAVNITDELFSMKSDFDRLQEEAKLPMQEYHPLRERMNQIDTILSQKEEELELYAEELREKQSQLQKLTEKCDSLTRELEIVKQSSLDKEKDLRVIQQNMANQEQKLLDLAKQFQEYQRSHR